MNDKKTPNQPAGLDVKQISSETVVSKCGVDEPGSKAAITHFLHHILQGVGCVLNPENGKNRVDIVVLIADLEPPVEDGERMKINGHFELLSTMPTPEAFELLTVYTAATMQEMESEEKNTKH